MTTQPFPGGILIPDLDFSKRIGLGIGRYLQGLNLSHQPRVLIAKNTAGPNYSDGHHLAGDLIYAGDTVTETGPMPVPALIHLTRTLRYDLGVFIAGGRPGGTVLRLFNRRRESLDEATLSRIVAFANEPDIDEYLKEKRGELGKNTRVHDWWGRYIEVVKCRLSDDIELDHLRIVVDCANGAAYEAAPAMLRELGIEVEPYGVIPDGKNLEADDCGYRNPKSFGKHVRDWRADLGIAFNADGDDFLMVDRHGNKAEPLQLIAAIGDRMPLDGLLVDRFAAALHLVEVHARTTGGLVFGDPPKSHK